MRTSILRALHLLLLLCMLIGTAFQQPVRASSLGDAAQSSETRDCPLADASDGSTEPSHEDDASGDFAKVLDPMSEAEEPLKYLDGHDRIRDQYSRLAWLDFIKDVSTPSTSLHRPPKPLGA